METLYGLKRKTTNRWLKFLLLLFVAVGFGIPNLNAQTKAIKVANNQELIQAMGNTSIGTIELAAGYYEFLNTSAEPGTKVVKKANDPGNRDIQCQYYIVGSNVCFAPELDSTFVWNIAFAGTFDPGGCGCCPGPDLGSWSVISKPAGSTVIFIGPINAQTIFFKVNMAGNYILRYTWGAPYNSLVETEYFFYGPVTLDLSAPDVCGLSTLVDFTLSSAFPDPGTTVTWTLDGAPYAGPTSTGQFELTVPLCGYHTLKVVVEPTRCPPDSAEIIIDFSCDPIADAGPDQYICDDVCFTIYGTTGLPRDRRSDDWTINWSYLPDNNHLTILPAHDSVVNVCRVEDSCAYGQYDVIMSVINGECDDADTMTAIFYQQPLANAGPDQFFCGDFCFSLAAVPFEYCGEPGVNYWSHTWWTLVSQPDNCTVTYDALDPATNVCITNCDPQACAYGPYVFVWHELNVKIDPATGDTLWGESHCYSSDEVVVTINEDPAPNAGPDVAYCETDINGQGIFIFGLNGALDEPCYGDTPYTFHWELVSQPDACDIEITPGVIDPTVYIRDCDPCEYGPYVFKLTQANGYYDATGQFVEVCSSSDSVTVTIFESPALVDAGDDMVFCNTFAFTLYGIGDEPCYENTVVIYNWAKIQEPGQCTVTFNDPDDIAPGVVISDCNPDSCAFGEYIFALTQSNGYYDENGVFVEVCSQTDSVMVTILEQPDASAGDDYHACVDIANSPYILTMDGSMEYCYTMYGVWAKSCGPGEVVFDDLYSAHTTATFSEPGRYVFTWTEWNDACEDTDTVVFDLLEQPTASADDTSLIAPCDDLCYSLIFAGINKYEYFGTDQGDCPNYFDRAHWSYVSGPTGDPAEVVFADDTDPATDICVSTFGCYTVRWNEVNKPDDRDYSCEDYVDVFVQFVQTPVAFAGDDATLCGTCYTMTAVPSIPENTNCPPTVHQSYWTYLGYIPPDPFCDLYTQNYPCFEISDWTDPNAQICVCYDDYYGMNYGSYGFVWTETNGICVDYDTVWITFNKIPDDLPLSGCISSDNCSFAGGPIGPNRDVSNCGCTNCWYPEDGVFTVCANTCGYMHIDWNCLGYPPIPGYTYEWSFIGPAGSSFQAEPLYYDCTCGWVGSDYVYLCFGECCDTARLYLTITSPEGCVNTEEWKFYVQHPPVATITGPEVAEVGDVFEYSIPDPENPCYLYIWNVQHCGEIVYGQGTGTIGVHWTNYNQNGGWGLINVGVYDTCTCCCSSDSLVVKIYPQGTLGDGTLSGHVYYHNNFVTPLNGVAIQLWNGGIPVQSTSSFNDIEGGNGVGYFEFPGISGVTNFGITATYGAPWYGANATDALAVELKVINSLPGSFVYDTLVFEAMDVNNSITTSATDALWIKQRAINMVNYFPAGNWVFPAGMSSTAGTYDIYTLNAGDANRSNIPNSNKTTPAIDLVNDGTINVVTGQEFELPIRIADASQFGAITLNIGYNSALIDVVDVVALDGMLSNISNGNVSIAWSSVNPMVLAENDVVVTLKVKAISQFAATESLFSIGVGSEFADASASVIEPVTLKTFGITTEKAPEDYFLSSNRPNPFNNSTFIEYTMPETGKVKLSVLDMLGQEIAVIVNATQSAGSYTVEFSAAGLSTGVYIYKITVDGETRDFISTQRMVISH